MERRSLVDLWSTQTRTACGWSHPLDTPLLAARSHSFNLDFPVSPYVGDVLHARMVILGANAGYNPVTTPVEFRDANDTYRIDNCQRMHGDALARHDRVIRQWHARNRDRLIAIWNARRPSDCPVGEFRDKPPNNTLKRSRDR